MHQINSCFSIHTIASLVVASCTSLTVVGCNAAVHSNSALSTPVQSSTATVEPNSNNTQESLPVPTSSSTIEAQSQSKQQLAQSTAPKEPLQVPNLEKGMSYKQARQIILNAGWQPIPTTTDNPLDGTDGWRKSGYTEVTSCSGTGMGFCRFEFSGAGNRKFVVITGGREATVQHWWDEALQPAVQNPSSDTNPASEPAQIKPSSQQLSILFLS